MSVAVDTSDDYRLKLRAATKQRILQAEVNLRDVESLRRQQAECDRLLDAATEQHGEQTRVIQERLTNNEAEMKRLLAEREPIPDNLASERADLLQELESANQSLQREVDSSKKAKRRLQAKIDGLLNECNVSVLENELANQLSKPEWVARQWALNQLTRSAAQQLKDISKKLQQVQQAHDNAVRRQDAPEAEHYHAAIFRWSAMQNILADFRSQLDSESRELRQRMLDE